MDIVITSIEETMGDGEEFERFFRRTTGRNYNADKESSVNDIRRICMAFWNLKIGTLSIEKQNR